MPTATQHLQHEEHPHHHQMPTSGSALTGVAISATLHCLTGCAIGEIAGMAIGTALGFSNLATLVLAILLAFFFGYTLTSLPLLRSGLALATVVPIALASDTLSIATMEIVDNLIVVLIPGAMHAGLGDVLFWGSLAFALVVAGAFAVPVNRYLIARGKGHAVVHETGVHGGPPVKVVGVVAALAFVFGSAVLAVEAFDSEGAGEHMAHGGDANQDPVRGLGVSAGGMTLELDRSELRRGRPGELTFRILGSDGHPLRDFQVEHEKRMHFIVARRDMRGFQHLHPKLGSDATWSTPLTLTQAGSYRVFADFKRNGRSATLASDVQVDGPVDWKPLPPSAATATTDGYSVRITGDRAEAGREATLRFDIRREGRPVRVQRYLGAGGHLVALREGDMAYLHVHPTGAGGQVSFATEFPSAGRYRLFLQFKRGGRVHTAAFTKEVAR